MEEASVSRIVVTECIFTLLTKLKVTIVNLLVAHPEGAGMQHETPC